MVNHSDPSTDLAQFHGTLHFFFLYSVNNFFGLPTFSTWASLKRHNLSKYASVASKSVIHFFFSSPELKAQVSFYDRRLSFVCSSVCKLLRFRLLLNPWANFNQTLHKSSLGEGDSSFFQMKGNTFLQGEIIAKKYKYTESS
jgi:hypothetical protein